MVKLFGSTLMESSERVALRSLRACALCCSQTTSGKGVDHSRHKFQQHA
jgi:hypothetical protein